MKREPSANRLAVLKHVRDSVELASADSAAAAATIDVPLAAALLRALETDGEIFERTTASMGEALLGDEDTIDPGHYSATNRGRSVLAENGIYEEPPPVDD
jgi:hypothetical protein